MAKNITLMGASYSDVPAINLPQTGGGTARFDDVSVTTATASDVAQGKIFVASDGTVTTGTASGTNLFEPYPTDDGDYILHCTVTNGERVFSWRKSTPTPPSTDAVVGEAVVGEAVVG